MRFGICADTDKARAIADAGGDYIELGAAKMLVPEGDDAAWQKKRAEIESLPLPVEAFNSFLPGDLKIVGENINTDRAKRYVATALERAAQIGASVIVFGSGGARRVPEGFSRDVAREQILRFLEVCADESDRTGIVVAIEPLTVAECNIINSLAEGAGYVHDCGRPGVRLLADSYHMENDGESIAEAQKFGALLAHAHTADTGRFAPATGTYDHAAFLAAMKAGGYDKRVSIECSFRDFDTEIAPAIAHLRHAAE